MSIEIDAMQIQKLTHESVEIRLRTLEQIDAKFSRVFFKMHGEFTIDFKGHELCKQLIRWFGFQPIQAAHKVLHLLCRLLKSSYGENIVKQLSTRRLKAETHKMKQILYQDEEALRIIAEIEETLESHELKESAQIEKGQTVNDLVSKLETLNVKDFPNLEIVGVDNANDAGGDADTEYTIVDSPRYLDTTDYELTWSRPVVLDYGALKASAKGLTSTDPSDETLRNTLEHLQVTLKDYPSEFMLQPPHIFCKLLDLFDRTVDLDTESSLYAVLDVFLECLQKRLIARKRTINFALPTRKEATRSAKMQLKIDKAMQMLLDKCLDHLQVHFQEKARHSILLLNIINGILQICNIQRFEVEHKPIVKLTRIGDSLREPASGITVCRIKYLLVVLLLHDIAKINFSYSCAMPSIESFQPLADLIYDLPFQHHFSERFQQITSLLCRLDSGFFTKCENVRNLKAYIKAAVNQLLSHKTATTQKTQQISNSKDLIQQSPKLVPILDMLKSLKLVQRLFGAIVDCNAFYVNDVALKTQALSLLLQLMHLNDLDMKNRVYQEFAISMKKHFSCLMNGESYCVGVKNTQLLEACVIGLPFDTSIVMQLVNDYQEKLSEPISEHCLSIILLLLKTEHFFTAKSWSTFLEIVLPITPLLQCCFKKSDKIAEIMLRFYNPDEKNLPFVATLRGNVNLLFSCDNMRRSEALSRIIYTLHSLDALMEYMPNIMEISDLLSHDICILEPPRDLKCVFTTEKPLNQLMDLKNLLSLLDTDGLEPQMRKSTLIQMNIICQNWGMSVALCEQQGHYLILKALESALQKKSHADYSDTVIPTVSILAKMLCCDTSFRQKISEVPNIYVLLLRALFLYPHNIEVRQDAAISLFLLVYGSFLIVDGNKRIVEAPRMLSDIKAPIKCTFVSNTYSKPRLACKELTESIGKNPLLRSHVRQLIAHYYCNEAMPNEADIRAMSQELDIDPQLLPTQMDRRLACSTVMERNIKSLLAHMGNATDHSTLLKSTVALHLQFILGTEASSNEQNFGEGISVNNSSVIADLYKTLKRFLQLAPGNDDDYELFKEILSIFGFCLRNELRTLKCQPVVMGLATTLRDDFNHGLITLLRNSKLPVGFYSQLCTFLKHLLEATKTDADLKENAGQNFGVLYANLFELTHNLIDELFALRDLQRVRCLLELSTTISNMYLELPEKLLDRYCKFFKKLSLTLKSSSQTGSQWHRDCLLISLNLYNQMPSSSSEMQKFTKLSYISGLCGHADQQVRALAWCCLSEAAHLDQDEGSGDTASNAAIKQTFINDLAYLPGGFLACCLSTMLDSEEAVLIRHMAGNFFVMMLDAYIQMGQSIDLLQCSLNDRSFFYEFSRALNGECVLTAEMPPKFLSNEILVATYSDCQVKKTCMDFVCCEIFSCFCRICCKLMRVSDDFATAIRSQDFVLRLYELLKLPVPSEVIASNPAYFTMCGDICQLYALCAKSNFDFLQRVLCHDEIWLAKLCSLLDAPYGTDEAALIKIVQLFLLLCRDDTAYEFFCEKLNTSPQSLAKLCKRVINFKRLNTPLQACVLAFLSFLLIKSQNFENYYDDIDDQPTLPASSFLAVIESSIDAKIIETTQQHKSIPDCQLTDTMSLNSRTTYDNASTTCDKLGVNESTCSIASFLCIELFRIFTHLYSAKACKFQSTPSAQMKQVSETFSLLLKQSKKAQETARNLKVFEHLVRILRSFLNEFDASCTTFIRRFGDHRKVAVISNFQLIFNVMLNWFSSPSAMVTEELHAVELSKILMQIWPWLTYSSSLELLVLRVCSFLSEYSFIICRQFSTPITSPSNGQTILQLIIKIVVAETQRVKPSAAQNFPIITSGLRVVMNCCVCAEGRLTLVKDHVLNIFDGLYPLNPKSPRVKLEIINAWMRFWELFSRYNEGSQARNLNGLCSLITDGMKHSSSTRLLALKILRNMCFNNSNRSQILSSSDFIRTIDKILETKVDLPPSPRSTEDEDAAATVATCEPQFIVCVALWKLISGGVKFVSMIRGTQLARKLENLREHLLTLQVESPQRFVTIYFALDLTEVLNIIHTLFHA